MAARRDNNVVRERVVLAYDHAQLTGDLTIKLFKAPRRCLVEKVEYINPTGLAEHAADYFAISAKNGATVCATISTDSAGAGDNGIVADTFTTLTNGTRAARTLASGDVLTVLFDETGTATLPAGRLVIHLLYL